MGCGNAHKIAAAMRTRSSTRCWPHPATEAEAEFAVAVPLL